jgi:uroporphyrinogen-III synthase
MCTRSTRARNIRVTTLSLTGRVPQPPLAGFTIGVTADRRADEQIKLLASRGAECVHGPVIKTHPIDSEDALGAATETLIAGPPDLIVLTTGLGVRSWLGAADALHLGDALTEVLAATELWARGPKATGALATAGFDIAWNAPNARYDDVIDALVERGAAGTRIGVQLDGAGAADLCARIRALGADVVEVPVYRWSLPDDIAPAERLVKAIVDGRIDAVTFTARPAVDNLFEIADLIGLGEPLIEAARSTVAMFCVGPVCATGLTDLGLDTAIVPERHRLGALVQLVAAHFAARTRVVMLAGHHVSVQGRSLVIDGVGTVELTDRERSLFDVLMERPGAVHSKRDLLRRVWPAGETDVHLVEVTMARLRQRLGEAATGIETVVRRGYRLSPD